MDVNRTEILETSSDKVVEILKKDNLRTKKFGHNKYQEEIMTLKNKLSEVQEQLQQKNDEVDMFKTNVTTIQLESQEKGIIIVKLNAELNNIKSTLKELKDNRQSEIVDTMKNKSDGEENLAKVLLENKDLAEHLSTLSLESEEVKVKYSELKQTYHSTLAKLVLKTEECHLLQQKLEKSREECGLYISTNESLQKDVDVLKQEMESDKNFISTLKGEIFEKNTVLRDLNLKLNRESKTREIKVEEESNCMTIRETIQPSLTVGREVKVTFGKALKLSKR